MNDNEPMEDFDEYNDSDATACANGDYNSFEEREVFNDGEMEDQLLDMEMEDRIGGTGYLEAE